MSETKFTPGPWEIDPHSRPDDEIEILGRPRWPCRRNGVRGVWRVARVDELYGPEGEKEANASLMAASPSMFEALQLARPYVASCSDNPGDDAGVTLAAIDGAIARALGF
jgi:hypothetical protein